jgi:hypothetical protein
MSIVEYLGEEFWPSMAVVDFARNDLPNNQVGEGASWREGVVQDPKSIPIRLRQHLSPKSNTAPAAASLIATPSVVTKKESRSGHQACRCWPTI